MYSSKNLRKKVQHLTLIEDWYNNYPNYDLSNLFTAAIGVPNIFSTIYVAIRKNPENATEAATETWNYYNVGADMREITNYFVTKYGLNYFAYNFNSGEDCTNIKNRIEAIYNANIYKYRKLIETMGYTYNPLYNVDANELYSNMEAIGDSSSDRTPDGTIINTSGTLDNNDDIGPSTITNYTNPYDENTGESADYVNDKTEQSAITSKQTYEEYSETTNIYNKPANHYTFNPDTGKYEPSGIFSVAAADSAFGVALGGAERYYAEKRIRKGNIGVTKSTELIDSQRKVVKFNILDEFFKDLEREIVVGIY